MDHTFVPVLEWLVNLVAAVLLALADYWGPGCDADRRGSCARRGKVDGDMPRLALLVGIALCVAAIPAVLGAWVIIGLERLPLLPTIWQLLLAFGGAGAAGLGLSYATRRPRQAWIAFACGGALLGGWYAVVATL